MRRCVEAELLGTRFRFETTPGLFSADRVDDGTRLLLDHCGTPGSRVLDMGCGWGALGLPIAARHLETQFLLVDRDALAAEYSRRNAVAHALANVEAKPSLGYRDVGEARFDLVLCNVPARIGANGIAYLVGAGAARLNEDGEVRVVVIRDLDPIVSALATERGWPVKHVVTGARHSVWSCGPLASFESDHESMYVRDRVTVNGLTLDRPHDINEDHDHLNVAVPMLLECLPKTTKKALLWRAGYGAAAVRLAQQGAVVAADRDLISTTFSRRNASQHGFTIKTRDVPSLADAVRGERFDLVVGEQVPSAGDEVAVDEWLAATAALAKGGSAIWLGRSKALKAPLAAAAKRGVESFRIVSRGVWEIVRLTRR